MNLKNKTNEYQESLGRTFDVCPKAVLGAAFASLASCGGERLAEAEESLKREWWILYNAGIVPQRPPFSELNNQPCGH
jgi:hypothetical protein